MMRGRFSQHIAGHKTYEAGTPGELEVIHYESEIMGETMLSHHYPTEDEIRLLIAGNPIALHIVGSRHPWCKIEVVDKEGEREKPVAKNEAEERLGVWLAAALDDPNTCEEMKADINAWFNAK